MQTFHNYNGSIKFVKMFEPKTFIHSSFFNLRLLHIKLKTILLSIFKTTLMLRQQANVAYNFKKILRFARV